MGKIKVSVILTSYNRPQKVIEAIASVQAQTYSNWELFIVDDNSNDATKAAIMHKIHNDPRCTIIHSGVLNEHRRLTTRYATCINLAIPRLTGDFVSYLTDDDIFYPRRFEVMVASFQMYKHVHVIYGKQRVVYLSAAGVPTSMYDRPIVGVTRQPVCKVDHNSIMHRRCCLDIVGGWDDSPMHWNGGDAVFFTKLARHWDFYPVDFLTDEHRMHPEGIQYKFFLGQVPW